ncbi:hypothetical protein BKA64DRAFT_176549 [Cadophora sp. MPI-SDFR-AT-0126]|nr:hypothetical protein BKA64DRAFT_176549 [Leotiomycetes sp. MPI-SDFR-AT-0126]
MRSLPQIPKPLFIRPESFLLPRPEQRTTNQTKSIPRSSYPSIHQPPSQPTSTSQNMSEIRPSQTYKHKPHISLPPKTPPDLPNVHAAGKHLSTSSSHPNFRNPQSPNSKPLIANHHTNHCIKKGTSRPCSGKPQFQPQPSAARLGFRGGMLCLPGDRADPAPACIQFSLKQIATTCCMHLRNFPSTAVLPHKQCIEDKQPRLYRRLRIL